MRGGIIFPSRLKQQLKLFASWNWQNSGGISKCFYKIAFIKFGKEEQLKNEVLYALLNGASSFEIVEWGIECTEINHYFSCI